MTVSPYLAFNGNCTQALALYEEAFGVKAGMTMRYVDSPPEEGYEPPAGTEDFIMHAQLILGSSTIFMCDAMPDNKCSFTSGISIHVSLDSERAVKTAFDILKVGGEVDMEPAPTFWSQYFCILTDKFGVCWMLSYQESAD